MLKNNHIRYALYGGVAIILSEAVYQYYLRRKKRLAEARRCKVTDGDCEFATETSPKYLVQDEITDYIMINEESQNCPLAKHRQSPSVARHNDDRCGNPYCFYRNLKKVIGFIDATAYSIDIAMYTLTLTDISDALKRATERGVKIRLISDHGSLFSSGYQLSSFNEAGIPVRFSIRDDVLMHHKFCIFDGPQRLQELGIDSTKGRSFLLSGSINWTIKGFKYNWESAIITGNSKILEGFENEFTRLWHKFTPPNIP